MQVSDFTAALEQIAPLRFAEAWDNVGLLAGDPTQSVNRALLCIDYTLAVAVEARELQCDFAIAYHPPLFSAIKRITADGPSSLIHDAIHRGVAIYSPHTALDVAPGGTNDMLAEVVGLIDPQPLRPLESKDYKLVTFVPESATETVAKALADAGAGQIGNYSHCTFRIKGTGTFLGNSESNPVVGKAGRLESADEIRLETVVPAAKVAAAIRALRAVHPYEEPAIDLVMMAPTPSTLGMGRVGNLKSPTPLNTLLDRIKQLLDIPHLLVAKTDHDMITRAAVCAGACGEFLDDAIKAGADFYLTGEIRHHDAIKAIRAGVTVVCTLHSNSERAVLKRVKSQLEKLLPNHPEIFLSRHDRDPFAIR